MPLPPLPETAIVLGALADDWRGAVRLAGGALADSGAALPGYADEMIRMIEEHGPYVVIAPGLALAHARPGPEVLADGLAVVTLATPVAFGHPHNDPVSVVLGLAIERADAHLVALAELANIFNDSSAIPALADAKSAAEVWEILGEAQILGEAP
ncbi:MAG: PTS sugar transporter subunit IIA [Lacisediminihabitans sp.]